MLPFRTIASLIASCALAVAGCGDSDGRGAPDASTDVDTDTDADTDCVVRVDGSLSGYDGHDGSSWALALASVHEGIAVAATKIDSDGFDACEVWVAAGVYKTTADADRDSTFRLQSGVALYGGFAGGELARDDRDVGANETVLSGDIGTVGEISDNAYHVVTGADGAVIDGFTITGGCASGNSGGGMINFWASPIVRNCVFTGNQGGPAWGEGGGMYNFASSPIVQNCTFSENTSYQGGGMYNDQSFPRVLDCKFSENSADDGGGMANYNSIPFVEGCVFLKNEATYTGGGMYSGSSDHFTVMNCVFWKNVANYGSGMLNYLSSPDVTNSTFYGNWGYYDEGGGGSGLENSIHSSPNVTNCIFWGNSDGEIEGLGIPTVTYSLVEGGCTESSNCTQDETGNIDADPLFVDAESGDLHLQTGTLCIDGGSTAALPVDVADLDDDDDVAEPIPFDLDGNPRVVGAAVDMGAYEIQ